MPYCLPSLSKCFALLQLFLHGAAVHDPYSQGLPHLLPMRDQGENESRCKWYQGRITPNARNTVIVAKIDRLPSPKVPIAAPQQREGVGGF